MPRSMIKDKRRLTEITEIKKASFFNAKRDKRSNLQV